MSFKTIIDNATGVVTQDGGQVTLPAATEQGQVLLANSAGSWTPYAWNPTFKNRIINGDMRVAQRGTAAVTTDVSYPVDRWVVRATNPSASFSVSQSSIAPPGFSNSILWTTIAGASASNHVARLRQAIEGSNIIDFAFGTNSAKTVTISFWVRSSVTGTYSLCVDNFGSFLPYTTYTTSYSINSSNTWERKSVTIPGCTPGPQWLPTSVGAMNILFDLGSGSNYYTATPNTWVTSGAVTTAVPGQANVVGTTGATFYLTGVQLELGSVATPFEMRPQQVELALCQRYYQRNIAGTVSGSAFGVGTATAAGNAIVYIKYAQAMRATPTVGSSSLSAPSTLSITDGGGNLGAVTALSTANYGDNSMALNLTSSSLVSGRSAILQQSASVAAPYAFIELSAEL